MQPFPHINLFPHLLTQPFSSTYCVLGAGEPAGNRRGRASLQKHTVRCNGQTGVQMVVGAAKQVDQAL